MSSFHVSEAVLIGYNGTGVSSVLDRPIERTGREKGLYRSA